ncbi:hypothetical protein C7G42_28740 [Bradyrhizobium sp. MOS003]|nr:hypothetical protein C7G42_28740 [Bradyrhizobium sp. MOS003]
MLRHCEEPLRRSNPDCLLGEILDCFATLAMTSLMQLCAKFPLSCPEAYPGHLPPSPLFARTPD